ncbi:MAG: hypothetical protein FJW39_00105 [Acidobacteria bacterium]|nr:hypothetical protein [Acidobacteriota bacterium]
MARLALAGLILVHAAAAQQPFRDAGVCARCHVVQVIEWSSSRHTKPGINCQSCHGPSAGHVANERNQVAPDRLPRAAAIAGLCSTCHTAGCPKTKQAAQCQNCHHTHALTDPNAKLAPLDLGDQARLADFERHRAAGERHVAAGGWQSARDSFAAALAVIPEHRQVKARLRMTERRLRFPVAGTEPVPGQYHAATGLPLRIRARGFDLELALVPGGDIEIGSEGFRSSHPVHTVAVAPFYLGLTEITQRQWTVLDPANPSTHAGPTLPVHNVSWNGARGWIARLNQRTSAAFRLPTEAEWETAAGPPPPDLSLAAWFRTGAELAPHPVGGKQPNPLGLFDMSGNVAEWCSPLMRPYPYSAVDGREDPAAEGLRVIRGGSYADPPELLHPALRHADRPGRQNPWNGFRVAISVP